jgi:tRNA U34 5-methylaminomethyl-2-thiouridine-forming methyltransferase MnmC
LSELKRTTTGDGSHSLFHPTLNEHYHSQHGAINESRHVFLHAAFDMLDKQAISILEYGFGTGLNALLTQQRAEELGVDVAYCSLEKYPLHPDVWQGLNYPEQCHADPNIFSNIHLAPWESVQRISPHFQLEKRQISFEAYQPKKDHYDIVYFDAFAPNHQPDVWSDAILGHCFDGLKPGGIWVSYCAQGAVRRRLSSVGFTVERIPGPPGKREMLRGRKL